LLSRYLVAMAAMAAAVGLRLLLEPALEGRLPLVTLFAGVAAAVWYGGLGPAILASALGYLACLLLFILPNPALQANAAGVVGLAAYVLTCVVVIGFGEALRHAQARASEQHELVQTTLASIGDAVITTDTAGRVTFLNQVAESLTGWTLQDAAGRPLEDVFCIVNEQTRLGVESPAARTLREGKTIGLANHTLLIAKDGTERPIEDSAAPIREEEGRLAGCVLVFRDVTARRQAERSRAESEARFRLMADAAPVLVWMSGPDKLCSWFNRPWLEFVGRTMEQELGNGWAENVHPEDVGGCVSTYESSFEARQPFLMEYRLRRHDGQFRWMLDEGVPIHDLGGEFLGYVGSCIDITTHKEAELALKETDRRKDEFLATLAHELRNPLAPIRHALEILKRGGDEQRDASARDTIDRQLTHLVRLVEDLLDVSRITRDQLELRK
jgi:PAS domain S-box-containing protein